MSEYADRQEVADKIDDEGGMYKMLFGYGLSVDDLPEGDKELRAAWYRIAELQDKFQAAVEAFQDLLPEPEGY